MPQRIQNLTAPRENNNLSYEDLEKQKAFNLAFTCVQGLDGGSKSLDLELGKLESKQDCFIDNSVNFSKKRSSEDKDKQQFLIYVGGKRHENCEGYKGTENYLNKSLKREGDNPFLGKKKTRYKENKEHVKNKQIKDLNKNISLNEDSEKAINDYLYTSNKTLINSKLNLDQKDEKKHMFPYQKPSFPVKVSCDLNLNEELQTENNNMYFTTNPYQLINNKSAKITNNLHSNQQEKSSLLGKLDYQVIPELPVFFNKKSDVFERILSKREKEILSSKFFKKENNLINIDYFHNEINLCNHLYTSLIFCIIHSDLFFKNNFINYTKTQNELIKFTQQLNINHQFFNEQMNLFRNLNLEINSNLEYLALKFPSRFENKPEINPNKISLGNDFAFNNLFFESPNLMNNYYNNNNFNLLTKIKCGEAINLRNFDLHNSSLQSENNAKCASASLNNVEKKVAENKKMKEEDNKPKNKLQEALDFYKIDVDNEKINNQDKNTLNIFKEKTSRESAETDYTKFNDLIRKLKRFSLRVKIKIMRKIKSEKSNNNLNKTLSEIATAITDKETTHKLIFNLRLIERKIINFNHFINKLKLRSKYLLKSMNNVILCEKIINNLKSINEKLYNFVRPNDLLCFQKLKKKIIRLAKLNVKNNKNELKLIEFVNGLRSNQIFISKDYSPFIDKFLSDHLKKRVFYNSIQMNSNDLGKIKNLISSVYRNKPFKLKKMLEFIKENKVNFSNEDHSKKLSIEFANNRDKNIGICKTGKNPRNSSSNFIINKSNSNNKTNLDSKFNCSESVMPIRNKEYDNELNDKINLNSYNISNNKNTECFDREIKEMSEEQELECSNKNIFYIIKELDKEYQNKIIIKGAIENLISPTYKKESNIYRKILCKIVDYIRIQLFQLILENKRMFYSTNKSNEYLKKNACSFPQKQLPTENANSDFNNNFVIGSNKKFNSLESDSYFYNDDQRNFGLTFNLIFQLEYMMFFKYKTNKSKGFNKKISLQIKNAHNHNEDNDNNFIWNARTDLKMNNQYKNTSDSLISDNKSTLNAKTDKRKRDTINNQQYPSVIKNSKNLRSQMMNFINNCKRERINRLLRSNHFKIKCLNKSQMNHYYKKIINNTIENLFFENKEVKLTIEDPDRIIFEKMKKIPKIKNFLDLKMSFLIEQMYKNSYFSRKLIEITRKSYYYSEEILAKYVFLTDEQIENIVNSFSTKRNSRLKGASKEIYCKYKEFFWGMPIDAIYNEDFLNEKFKKYLSKNFDGKAKIYNYSCNKYYLKYCCDADTKIEICNRKILKNNVSRQIKDNYVKILNKENNSFTNEAANENFKGALDVEIKINNNNDVNTNTQDFYYKYCKKKNKGFDLSKKYKIQRHFFYNFIGNYKKLKFRKLHRKFFKQIFNSIVVNKSSFKKCFKEYIEILKNNQLYVNLFEKINNYFCSILNNSSSYKKSD